MNAPRPAAPPRDHLRVLAAVAFSALVHVFLSGVLESPRDDLSAASRWLDSAKIEVDGAPVEPPLHQVSLELPVSTSLLPPESGARDQLPEPRPGGERSAQLDDGGAGRGGEREASQQAVNLAPRDDEALLSPIWRSRLERSQLNRQKNGSERRSPEDDRVSPRVTTLTFVSDGRGRPDPRSQQVRAAIGQQAFRRRLPPELHDGTSAPDKAYASLGVELRGSLARDGRAGRLSQGFARPHALLGADSSPANERGRQQDDLSSEQEAHNLQRSLLRASPAGGAKGQGRGGRAGGAIAAAGGERGLGFQARPNGSGYGRGNTIDPRDARRRSYLRTVASRIHGSWRVSDFPREAALAGRQGYTVVSFVVARDGSVGAVRITRPSGYPAFDQKMRQAVLRAAPFGPLPKELLPVLHHRHEFVVSNPVVRPVRP